MSTEAAVHPENARAGQGMVVLDIGADIGAVVVATTAELVGAEFEICPHGARAARPDDGAGWWVGDWHSHTHGHSHPRRPAWPHVGVLARPTPLGVEPSAVFPGLRAGRYDIWLRPAGGVGLTVDVVGGQVTLAEWSSGGCEQT